MANVRLLRQTLTDYDKQIRAINASYAGGYEAYTAAVDSYNALPYVQFINGERSSGGKFTATNVTLSDGTRRYASDGFNVDAAVAGMRVSGNSFASEPVAPTQLTSARREPNITHNDEAALRNPPQDMAGAAILNAKGYAATSALPSENQGPSKNSAFNDPEDPNNLKERGILARTLAGQLG